MDSHRTVLEVALVFNSINIETPDELRNRAIAWYMLV